MTEVKVSPETALVILLGARRWPKRPDLEAFPSFMSSYLDMRAYFVSPMGFGLPEENLLDLFDSAETPLYLYQEMMNFIDKRSEALSAQGKKLADIILYYVGHGGFSSDEKHNYFLAISGTEKAPLDDTSSIIASKLGAILRDKGRNLRRFLILDACFSAAVAHEAQASGSDLIRAQSLDAFADKGSSERGSSLLSASSAIDTARAPLGKTHTMFSGALLDVLTQGEKCSIPAFSMRQVRLLVSNRILEEFQNEAVRPEVHSPDQREGDIADIPLFPNPAWYESPTKEAANHFVLVRGHILKDEIQEALDELNAMAEKVSDLPGELQADFMYLNACTESRIAFEMYDKAPSKEKKEEVRKQPAYLEVLDQSLAALKEWLEGGLAGLWKSQGQTPQNMLYKMGNDSDLWSLLFEYKDRILGKIPENLRTALPDRLPPKPKRKKGEGGGGGGGGCVPKHTPIRTPDGEVEIQALNEGDEILSFDLSLKKLVTAHVARLYVELVVGCLRIDQKYLMTPSQPLFDVMGHAILAKDLTAGMRVMNDRGAAHLVESVECIEEMFEVYTLTTNHPTHNYLAYGLICSNKKPEPWPW